MQTNKKETLPRQQDEHQPLEHEESISESKSIVNPTAGTWLADMRREKNLRAIDVVPVIRARHPKFDAALYSKVERPEDYGVELIHETARDVQEAFCYEPRRAHRSD